MRVSSHLYSTWFIYHHVVSFNCHLYGWWHAAKRKGRTAAAVRRRVVKRAMVASPKTRTVIAVAMIRKKRLQVYTIYDGHSITCHHYSVGSVWMVTTCTIHHCTVMPPSSRYPLRSMHHHMVLARILVLIGPHLYQPLNAFICHHYSL